MKNNIDRDWNNRYLTGDTPWTSHELATAVLDIIQLHYPNNARILEIGCGYGQEAIALAKLGYQVTAVDLSPAAIEQARINAKSENTNVHFQTFDLMHDQNSFAPFDVIFDISVLHTIDNSHTRRKFAQAIASLLKPQALWINVSCLSPDVDEVAKATNVKAPPALSKEDLTIASQDIFILISQQTSTYQISRDRKLVAFPNLISTFKRCD